MYILLLPMLGLLTMVQEMVLQCVRLSMHLIGIKKDPTLLRELLVKPLQ